MVELLHCGKPIAARGVLSFLFLVQGIAYGTAADGNSTLSIPNRLWAAAHGWTAKMGELGRVERIYGDGVTDVMEARYLVRILYRSNEHATSAERIDSLCRYFAVFPGSEQAIAGMVVECAVQAALSKDAIVLQCRQAIGKWTSHESLRSIAIKVIGRDGVVKNEDGTDWGEVSLFVLQTEMTMPLEYAKIFSRNTGLRSGMIRGLYWGDRSGGYSRAVAEVLHKSGLTGEAGCELASVCNYIRADAARDVASHVLKAVPSRVTPDGQRVYHIQLGTPIASLYKCARSVEPALDWREACKAAKNDEAITLLLKEPSVGMSAKQEKGWFLYRYQAKMLSGCAEQFLRRDEPSSGNDEIRYVLAVALQHGTIYNSHIPQWNSIVTGIRKRALSADANAISFNAMLLLESVLNEDDIEAVRKLVVGAGVRFLDDQKRGRDLVLLRALQGVRCLEVQGSPTAVRALEQIAEEGVVDERISRRAKAALAKVRK